jgi:L-cysteine S-thiosulfotransferase
MTSDSWSSQAFGAQPQVFEGGLGPVALRSVKTGGDRIRAWVSVLGLCLSLGLLLLLLSLPLQAQVLKGPGLIESPRLRSGLSYASADLKATQADDSLNPAFLWIDQGQVLWNEGSGPGKPPSCASCHQDWAQSMRGVSMKYPRWDPGQSRLINLEGQINACRTQRQHLPALAYESDELLSLTALVSLASRGMVLKRSLDESLIPSLLKGQARYESRMGQNNLACMHCHTQNAGQRLGGETISQGQPHAYPAYRLEWQRVGSLQKRLRACLSGVKAEIWPLGSEELTELELYLSFRGEGLAIESPGVRR